MTIEPLNELRKYIECDVCGAKNPRKRCSRCRCAYYCSVDCQKNDWRESHKSDCVPYETMCAKMAEKGGTLPAITTPVNTACGICLEEPIQQQVVLKACKHAFCFRCLNDWQDHSSKTSMRAAENSAMSCPYCRQDIEKSVVEDAIENSYLYINRAKSLLQANDPEHKKYFELALAEVDMVLVTDERDLNALCVKCHILRYTAPEDAIQAYERLLELDREGSANYPKLKVILDKVKVALDSEDEDEAKRLQCQVKAYLESGAFMCYIGSGPQRLFDVMIDFAEAHEAAGNWQEAFIIYGDTLNNTIDNNLSTVDGQKTRKILAGLSRCQYQQGFYENSVAMGKNALAIDRLFPGVHKQVALPQLALGQVEAARTTMRRGVVYEKPWDNVNRQKNIAFLEECLCEKTTEAGV